MAHDENGDNVGYRRPPKHTQFKKGHSGNPRGRPKAIATFKSDLAAELRETLTLTENGKVRRITKQRALIKTLAAAALKNDVRAVGALLACIRSFGVDEDKPTPTESVDLGDLDMLEAYVAQQRKQRGLDPRQRATPKDRSEREEN